MGVFKLIEDIVEKQALSSLRRFYTQDADYALATQVDSDLIASALDGWTTVGHMTEGGLVVPAVAGSAGDFSDQGFRDGIQILDDANVPMDNRKLVIPRQHATHHGH